MTPLSKDPAGIPKRMQQARIDRGLGLYELMKDNEKQEAGK
jgi:hypothetical protein